MEMYLLGFHAVILAHHLFAFFYSELFLNFKESDNVEIQNLERFKLRFLTMWNMTVQSFYLMYVVYAGIREYFNRNEKLKATHESVKGLLYTTIIFPSGVFVCGTFWILWSIDRELVFPRIFDEFVPGWLNHSIHSSIILLPTIGLLSKKTIPKWRTAIFVASMYYLLYQITVLYTYFETSFWLYKVFAVLSWTTRLSYSFLNFIITVVLVQLAIFLQKQVNTRKYMFSNHRSVSKKLT